MAPRHIFDRWETVKLFGIGGEVALQLNPGLVFHNRPSLTAGHASRRLVDQLPHLRQEIPDMLNLSKLFLPEMRRSGVCLSPDAERQGGLGPMRLRGFFAGAAVPSLMLFKLP